MFQMQHTPASVPFPAAFGCGPIAGVSHTRVPPGLPWDSESAALAGAWHESRAETLLMDFEQDMDMSSSWAALAPQQRSHPLQPPQLPHVLHQRSQTIPPSRYSPLASPQRLPSAHWGACAPPTPRDLFFSRQAAAHNHAIAKGVRGLSLDGTHAPLLQRPELMREGCGSVGPGGACEAPGGRSPVEAAAGRLAHFDAMFRCACLHLWRAHALSRCLSLARTLSLAASRSRARSPSSICPPPLPLLPPGRRRHFH